MGARHSLLAAVLLLVALPSLALAAGPPFPSPTPDQAVHDTADVLLPSTRIQAEDIADAVNGWSGAEVVVFTQRTDGDSVDQARADDDAAALLREWSVGGDDGAGIVILADLTASGELGAIGIAPGPGMGRWID